MASYSLRFTEQFYLNVKCCCAIEVCPLICNIPQVISGIDIHKKMVNTHFQCALFQVIRIIITIH